MTTSLQAFLNPSSIAFVGATERSVWSNVAYDNLKTLEFSGEIYPVNRRGGKVYGRAAATSASAIGAVVDAALLMVPAAALEEAILDLHAAGIGHAVVLSSGFAETGVEGRQRQENLARFAAAHGVRILGPNCLGFANFANRTALWTSPLRAPLPAGSLGIVSQSGALAGQLSYMAQVHGIGLSRMVSTGNEADIDLAEVVEYLVEDETTHAIAVFAETIRNPARFAKAAASALEVAKPIVVLKMGASEIVARAAQAHTGALVGDDRVFDAICHRYGLIRVRSLEDLLFTAALAQKTGPLPRAGIAVASISGGVCEIMAERAAEEGVPLAQLSDATQDALRGVLPSYATPQNPLDITGAAVLQPDIFGDALHVLSQDEAVGAVCVVVDVPNSAANDTPANRAYMQQVARGLQGSPVPAVAFSHYVMQVTPLSRELARDAAIPHVACGIHHAMTAIGAIHRWSQRVRRPYADVAAGQPCAGMREQLSSEYAVTRWLSGQGVPVIPTQLTRTAEEAAAFALQAGGPVVLKIASPHIAHKTEVGGVVLNLQSESAVAAAWIEMMRRVTKERPDARIDGILAAPMRQAGVELFVGTLNDLQWGPTLAVGLGGVWVEALRDTSLRLLPVSREDVLEMLAELRGARLLDGWRGAPAADKEKVADAIVAIGNAALRLGPGLASLEVNPLRALGETVEALDALAVWRADS